VELIRLMQPYWTLDFVLGLISIMFINIILSGDNAVVIAMAVRSLGKKQRRRGIMLGTAGAVVLRIGLTFFAAKLLDITFLKLAGGLLIGWLAVKLFVEGGPEDGENKEVRTVGKAVLTILVADLIMSVDNVLAVAGASKGNLVLLIFGLGTSIPLVVFASNLLAKLMDRYPIIVYMGAAVLGKVSGEMIITDPFVVKVLHNPGQYTTYGAEVAFALGVIVAGKAWMRLRAGTKPEVAVNNQASPFYMPDWDLR
jgi:YjbE family integral membrane protein